jgi:hypothetical protein
MSAESLRSEIDFVLSSTGCQSLEAALALITDFLRVLHELMVKSDNDQLTMLAQVQAVIGAVAVCHLARTLDASAMALPQYRLADDAPLYARTELICKQRGFEPGDGRHLLAHFLKALDEERRDKYGNVESAPVMVYWGVGHEAAYHLGGLYIGDESDVVATELGGYLDPGIRRFHAYIDMWRSELMYAREQAE